MMLPRIECGACIRPIEALWNTCDVNTVTPISQIIKKKERLRGLSNLSSK